jgi:hypothetical protein
MARLLALALVLPLFAAPALADTCQETPQVNIDCTLKSPGGAPRGQSTKPAGETRERLKQKILEDSNARNAKLQEIKDLADGAIRQHNMGDLETARTLYGAALREAGEDAELAMKLRRYVEAGTGETLESWYGTKPDGVAAAPAAAPPPAAEQQAAPALPKPMLGITSDPEYKKLLENPRLDQVQSSMKSLPPECQQMLGTFLENSEDGDSGAATASYRQLRARCDGEMRRVADQAGAPMPERILNDRMMGLGRRAMGTDPNAVIAGIGNRGGDASGSGGDAYDPAEVMDFGLALLGIFGGVAAMSGHPVAVPAVRGAPPGPRSWGSALPLYRPQPAASRSTITGLGNQ